MADLDLNELERLAREATPQDFDTAHEKRDGGVMDCPICHGEGSVDVEAEYCNYDGRAIGVEFYGIGQEFGAAERYYRAARPAVVLAMIARIRELEAGQALPTIQESLKVAPASIKSIAEVRFLDDITVQVTDSENGQEERRLTSNAEARRYAWRMALENGLAATVNDRYGRAVSWVRAPDMHQTGETDGR